MSEEVSPLEVILTTGRTIEQGKSLVGVKLSQIAKNATAVCFMDPEDMEKLALSENDCVKIRTSEGEIVVKVRQSDASPHKGIIFMPLGIYANWIIPPGSDGIGVPRFKGVKALIAPTDEKVLEVEELLEKLMAIGRGAKELKQPSRINRDEDD